ncbi:MAG TPA: MATE family efflux transporter [Acetomicrobium flavidum]|nr:MATE family efflux transporter [Acetomicrobium flavidum]HOM31040.1 MATE family efflux transporter [Acetomicrobium flavidum]HPP14254.1 MATE family efflux transporter [Acetomicrobium flavidum]
MMNVKRKAISLDNLFDNDKLNKKLLDKYIWILALPSLLELMLATLFGMVDMIMVGNVSAASLAAVGISNQPMMLILAVFQALNVGTTVLVARFIGTGDRRSSGLVLRQTLILTAILGVLTSLIGFLFARRVVVFMGAKPEVIPLATSYFGIVALGSIFIAITMGITAALRGAGDTVSPMKYNILSNLINVFGNYILIYGKLGFPAMGVTGAALSTTISRGLGMMMAFYAVHRQGSIFSNFPLLRLKVDVGLVKRMLRIGLPSGLEQVALRTGQIEFARTAASLGTMVFAAHQIALNVVGLSFAPGQAFGIAATTLVGQSLGAGRPDVAERCGFETRRLGMIIAFSIALLFFFFGRQIADIYINDAEVTRMAAKALKIVAIMQPLQSTQFILAGALRGAGDTRWPLLSTMIGIWCIRVVFAKVFVALGFGLIGLWTAQLLDQLFRSIFIYKRYTSDRWKTIRV